jgi:predicted dithiol-disulfide oxidoreductase (DUF899 family)
MEEAHLLAELDSRRTPVAESPQVYPNESAEYRRARNELLAAELDARRAVERAAALRRSLPPGGVVSEDYVFQSVDGDGAVRAVPLSGLFGPSQTILLLYNYMFGPDMDSPCPSCTSILDSLDGAVPHLTQRASFAAVVKSPLQRLLPFAAARGWRNLRLLSSAGTAYNRDYHGESPDGAQVPTMNVFVKDGDRVRHFWGAEEAPSDPGQEPRNLDLFWPMWHLLDATPSGRGDGDFPRLTYDAR